MGESAGTTQPSPGTQLPRHFKWGRRMLWPWAVLAPYLPSQAGCIPASLLWEKQPFCTPVSQPIHGSASTHSSKAQKAPSDPVFHLSLIPSVHTETRESESPDSSIGLPWLWSPLGLPTLLFFSTVGPSQTSPEQSDGTRALSQSRSWSSGSHHHLEDSFLAVSYISG